MARRHAFRAAAGSFLRAALPFVLRAPRANTAQEAILGVTAAALVSIAARALQAAPFAQVATTPRQTSKALARSALKVGL
jgi:hypothetical protein